MLHRLNRYYLITYLEKKGKRAVYDLIDFLVFTFASFSLIPGYADTDGAAVGNS